MASAAAGEAEEEEEEEDEDDDDEAEWDKASSRPSKWVRSRNPYMRKSSKLGV